ncbi:MAG: sigma-54-dependent transcriptional regulator [Anaerolineae bacterium]
MNRRVLVVDDEPSVRAFCVRALANQGYTVRTAFSGQEALALLTDEPFDLLVADVRMPGMSGLELMDRITALGLDVPTIIITGLGTLDNSIQALRAGAVDFVTKPFGRDELRTAVARALLQARVARERARLRVLEPVLELARQVRQGAGLTTICQTIIDLAAGQPGSRGAAIILEDPGQGGSHVAAARGVMLGLSSVETDKAPAVPEGQLMVRAAAEVAGDALRELLLSYQVETLVAAPLDSAGTHFGEMWLALDSPPDDFDPYYSEAVTSLACHAANLFASVQLMQGAPVSSAA